MSATIPHTLRERNPKMFNSPLGDVFYSDIVESDYFRIKAILRKPKVDCQNDAYDLFLKNWNDRLFPSIQEYKALIVNHESKALVEISFQEHRAVKQEAGKIFFQKIKAFGENNHVILGQNHPYKPFEVTHEVLNTSKLFKDEAEKVGVVIFDHLIISRMGYLALPGFEKFYNPVI